MSNGSVYIQYVLNAMIWQDLTPSSSCYHQISIRRFDEIFTIVKLNCYFSVSRKIRIATICNFAPKSSTCAPCALPRWRWIKIKSKQKSRENIGCHNLFTMGNFVVWRCCPKEIVILWNCDTLRTFDNQFSFADTLTVAGIFLISSLLSHLLSIYLPKTSTGYQSFGAWDL